MKIKIRDKEVIMTDQCIFCKIAKKEIPCNKIYESSSSLAFLDIKPHAKGHTVVIPKSHGETIFDINDKDARDLMIDVKKVMLLLQERINPDGFNVGWNHNKAGGQAVPHLHIHILPRYKNDGGGSMHSIVKNPGSLGVDEVVKIFK